MGIGFRDGPMTPYRWNSGSCDIMAVALHRLYGLPLMASFEWGHEDGEVVLGYLVHAWVMLPDGRALDASGPHPMPRDTTGRDPDDPWVEGHLVRTITDDDPHLLDSREEDDYTASIAAMDATGWIRGNLAATLASLGIEPLRHAESDVVAIEGKTGIQEIFSEAASP